jgi:hypothetical protein
MDPFRLADVNARLDHARDEYTKALIAERKAGQSPVQNDRVKLASVEYDQALDAFIQFMVKGHDPLAPGNRLASVAAPTSGTSETGWAARAGRPHSRTSRFVK